MPKYQKTNARTGEPKKARMSPQQRAQRMQRILFLGLAILVVLSMILALVVKY